ncbi:MAG: hypothetical protein QM638_01620 [Nocardioides sp.]|uniref:hypothetical protein n=1 Tax=Nocardioides sp. TaxID=35761 RepID=UPI0039E22FA3
MATSNSDRDEFESFYKDVRGRLLLQTWALTGDLTVASKSVRDALVICWHHWRKVRGLDTGAREDWVRPIAWTQAQRRRTVPHLHRDKGLDPEVRATLDALADLPTIERKVLLLAHLSSVSLPDLAREVGITQSRAERELQTATAGFALARGVPSTEILTVFEGLAEVAAEQRWPRPSILTRAGVARRRTFAVAGVAAVLAALVGTGFAVSHGGADRPSIGGLSLHGTQTSSGSASPSRQREALASTDLLSPDTVGGDIGGSWTTQLTSDNLGNAGVALPCQRSQVAGSTTTALVRTFSGVVHGQSDRVLAYQAVESSADRRSARATYQRSLSWLAGCRDSRVQLIDTRTAAGVGDQAMVFGLRDWNDPVRALVVGVARSGDLVTSVAVRVPALTKPTVSRVATLLGDAVASVCGLPGGKTCTATESPRTTSVRPLSTGHPPAMLSVVDLPPIAGVSAPWVGTKATSADDNLAATRCDQTSFDAAGIDKARTRTFVIPDDTDLDAAFGLTETIGGFSGPKAATAFVTRIGDRLSSCEDRQLGSHVTRLASSSTKNRSVTTWRVRVETSKTKSVVYLMAAIREGDAVAQLGFVPSGTSTLAEDDFVALATRAADRLGYL